MTSEPEVHHESVNGRFADYLATRQDAIHAEWLQRVRDDPKAIPTETLNIVALKDHLPQILADLMNTLDRFGSESVAEQAVRAAQEHGVTRLRQAYESPELLRAVLIFHLRAFEDLNPDEGMAERPFISTTFHGFVDEIAIDAAEEWLWAQMSRQGRLALGNAK